MAFISLLLRRFNRYFFDFLHDICADIFFRASFSRRYFIYFLFMMMPPRLMRVSPLRFRYFRRQLFVTLSVSRLRFRRVASRLSRHFRCQPPFSPARHGFRQAAFIEIFIILILTGHFYLFSLRRQRQKRFSHISAGISPLYIAAARRRSAAEVIFTPASWPSPRRRRLRGSHAEPPPPVRYFLRIGFYERFSGQSLHEAGTVQVDRRRRGSEASP